MNIEITRDEFKRIQTFFAVNPGAEKCSINVETERDDYSDEFDEEDEPEEEFRWPSLGAVSELNKQFVNTLIQAVRPQTQEEKDREEAEAFLREFNKRKV